MANKRQRKKNSKNNNQPRIRIRQQDEDIFKKVTNSAKSKLRRVNKNYGIDLSDEINLMKLDEFKTRKEFNTWVENMQRFTNRNNQRYQFVKNEYGLVMNKKELNELIRISKQNQRLAKQKIKEALNLDALKNKQKEVQRLKEQTLMLGEANVTGITVPPIFNFKQFRTTRTLKRAIDNIYKRSNPEFYDTRSERMKDNFIRSLEGSFNSNADKLVSMLRNMSGQDFYELYMSDRLVFDFSLYDSEGQFHEADEDKLRAMEQDVEDFYNGNFDTDFKHFPNR